MTSASSPIRFGIVGTGWRSEFFLRIAREMPDRFEVTGIVSRDAARGEALAHRWGTAAFTSVDDLIARTTPQFIVLSVPREAAPSMILHAAARGMPMLTETPPAADLDGARRLIADLPRGARVQVAEQYHLSPLLAAQLHVARSGKLGTVSQAMVAQCHDYHGISIMRRALGIGFDNAAITAATFDSPLVKGPDRAGDPTSEVTVTAHQVTGRFDFGDRLGVYDFADQQYFSWIRGNRLLVRGERGEINDLELRYLADHRTPVQTRFARVDTGEGGNLEGKFLRGILAGQEWAFVNPFMPGRLSDDEIAIAGCLTAMAAHVEGAPGFYSLAEASQDLYLSLLMKEAAATGREVRSSTQPWAEHDTLLG